MKQHRHWILLWAILLLFPILSGCGKTVGESIAEKEQEESEESQETVTEDAQLYILLYSNADTQRVFLESTESGRQEEYEYNGGTYIRNRYGDSITISQLQIGELVEVSYTEKKVLTELRVAKDTFLYDEVSNYKIDSGRDIISIIDSNYYYDEKLKVFSDSGIISMNELGQNDVLSFRGVEKKLLSISVEQGHGTITLRNTEDFVGGMITIGNVVAQTITEDMTLEIPEGSYTLSVAHDGYGGSREIIVNRFEELVIDLDALKGDGPGYCKLYITAVPEGAKVALNGAEVDCTQPMEIKYGAYRLTAEAEGYVTYSGTLVVNSEEAAFTIELESEEEAEKEATEEESKEDSKEDSKTTDTKEDTDEKTTDTKEDTDEKTTDTKEDEDKKTTDTESDADSKTTTN